MRVIASKQRKAIGEFFDHVRDAARENFDRDGACEPVALFLRDDEETAVLPLREFIAHKDVASAILNKAIEAVQPLAFIFVTEAWMALACEQPRDADGNPADLLGKYSGHLTEASPDGDEKPKQGVKEVVMLQCSSVAGESFMLTADIIRAEGAEPVLKPWVRMDNDKAEGRFIFNVTPLTERQ